VNEDVAYIKTVEQSRSQNFFWQWSRVGKNIVFGGSSERPDREIERRRLGKKWGVARAPGASPLPSLLRGLGERR